MKLRKVLLTALVVLSLSAIAIPSAAAQAKKLKFAYVCKMLTHPWFIEEENGIKAKLRIHVQTSSGPKEKGVTVNDGADLFELSENRACYQDGFIITEINAEPGNEFIR